MSHVPAFAHQIPHRVPTSSAAAARSFPFVVALERRGRYLRFDAAFQRWSSRLSDPLPSR
jgi:hypothetical protein